MEDQDQNQNLQVKDESYPSKSIVLLRIALADISEVPQQTEVRCRQ